MIRSFLFALLLLTPAWAANTYYVSISTGSDSNTSTQATSKTTPWAHLPGMRSASGNVSAYTPIAGDTFILKGCDDWGNANFPVNWTWSGTSANPITVTVDQTWYNTTNCPSGWNRPKFDAGSAVINPPECTNPNIFWQFNTSAWVNVNWIELVNYYWASPNSAGSCAGNTFMVGTSSYSASNLQWNYSYVHAWTHASGSGDLNGNAFFFGCTTCTVSYLVMDNSDGSKYSGGGMQWPTTRSIFVYTSNAIKPHVSGEYAYNNISHLGTGPGGNHPNCIETIGTIQGNGIFYIHDNWIHDMPNSPTEQCETLQVGNTGETDYVWNNVWCCNIGGGDVAQFPQNNQPGVIGLYFMNNVWEENLGNGVCANASNGTSWTSAFVMVNNFCLVPNTPNGTTQSQKMMSGSTITSPTTLQFSNNIVETITTANANGCNASETYPYAPSTSCQDTVGKGSNLTSTFWPAGYPTSDTTFACAEQTVSGVVESVCPQRIVNARPATGAWDSGAYEFPTFTTCAQPCTNQNVLPLANPPSVGGLVGENNCVTDRVFGTRVCRLTDANSDPSKPNFTWEISNGGSGDDNWVNPNDTMLLVKNTGGFVKPKSYNPINGQSAFLYKTSYPTTNGFEFPGTYADIQMTLNRATPYVAYGTNTNLTTASWTFDAPNFITPPTTLATGFNASFINWEESNGNCLPLSFGTANWANGGGPGANDSWFGAAWSSTAFHYAPQGLGQGSGIYATAYVPGKGCIAYNTQTGAVTADQGFSGGSGLTCTGSGCTGTATIADSYAIHNVKTSVTSVNGQRVLLISRSVCITTCTGTGNLPYAWFIDNTTVTYGYTGHQDSGHWAGGALGMVNIPGMPQPYYRTYLAPATTTALISPTPTACAGFNSLGQHMGWLNDNATDTLPFTVSTTTYPTYEAPFDVAQCPWWDEVYTVDTNGDGLTHRLAHTNNTDQSIQFSTQQAIAAGAQSGAEALFNSDWLDTLGCTNGATSCVPNGPDWLASHAYPPGYVINPNLNNVAGNSFRASGGTSNSSELNWGTACTSTCNDGTVSWTNLGAPVATATPRGDAFVVQTTPDTTAVAPTFSPTAGTYTGAQAVTLSSTSVGALICWNATGSPATDHVLGCAAGSTLYTGFLTVAGSETIYAVAGGGGYNDSSVSSAAYVIQSAVATPIFSPLGGTYTTTQSVTITSQTGATNIYTTDGSTPATSSGCTPSGTGTAAASPNTISVSSTETVKAIGCLSGSVNSAAGSAAYVIQPASGITLSITGQGVITGSGSIH